VRGADLSSLRAAISSILAQVSDCSPLPFQSSSDATKQWDTLSKAVMDAAVDTLGYSTRQHQDWFDSNDAEIQTLLNERNATFVGKLRSPNSVELQRRWALQRSQLQKRLHETENTWWLSKCGECIITLSLPRSGACNLAILNCAPVFVPRLLRCACGLVMQYCKVFF